MQRLSPQISVVVISLLLLLAGCRSGAWPLQTQAFLDVSGRYHSTGEVGDLGTLTLQISKVVDQDRFIAWLAGVAEDSGLSEGRGTIGDGHVILNFDRGYNSDFYYEGMVEVVAGEIRAIQGSFIFPDQTEPLPVNFDFVELLPQLPPDDPQQ